MGPPRPRAVACDAVSQPLQTGNSQQNNNKPEERSMPARGPRRSAIRTAFKQWRVYILRVHVVHRSSLPSAAQHTNRAVPPRAGVMAADHCQCQCHTGGTAGTATGTAMALPLALALAPGVHGRYFWLLLISIGRGNCIRHAHVCVNRQSY